MSPTDTDLESRVREALRAKADQIPDGRERFDPSVVTLADGEHRRSRAPLLVAAVLAFVVAVAIGFIALRDDRDTGTSQIPAAPSQPQFVATVDVQALPALTFQAKEFTTRPGFNRVTFSSAGGTHALTFADPELSRVHLPASYPGETSSGGVPLEPGRDYVIFCVIPGHRAAGMEAVVHVTG